MLAALPQPGMTLVHRADAVTVDDGQPPARQVQETRCRQTRQHFDILLRPFSPDVVVAPDGENRLQAWSKRPQHRGAAHVSGVHRIVTQRNRRGDARVQKSVCVRHQGDRDHHVTLHGQGQ